MGDKIIDILSSCNSENGLAEITLEQATDQILAIFEEAIPKEKEIRKYTPVSWLEKEYGYNEAIAEMKAKVKEGR